MGRCQLSLAANFVKMTCKTLQEQEHILICDVLVKASFSIVRELGGKIESVDSFAGVNLAFTRLQARIEHLSQLIEICPRVLCYLKEKEVWIQIKEKPLTKEKKKEEILKKKDMDKMIADVKSLKYVLENISEKDFKSQDGQDSDKCRISYTLQAHCNSKNENGEISELDRLPDTLMLSHAVDTWKTIALCRHWQSIQG